MQLGRPWPTPSESWSSSAGATEHNPTLTILSLSWRATDYLADQMKQGVL